MNRKKKIWIGVGIGVVLIMAIAVWSSDEEDTTPQVAQVPTVEVANTPALTVAPTSTPMSPATAKVVSPQVVTKELEEMLCQSIEEDLLVIEAAVSQDGNDLSLVLVVNSATTEKRARELGENFVRMTKNLTKDGAPGREIGTGDYNYTIGVYYPNEERVALGAKAKASDRITW